MKTLNHSMEWSGFIPVSQISRTSSTPCRSVVQQDSHQNLALCENIDNTSWLGLERSGEGGNGSVGGE